jgi:hypothetical protein
MTYGYQNYVLQYPNSILVSLILYLGCCFIGFWILKLNIFNSIKKNNFFYLHSPLVFLNLLILLLYPFVALELLNLFIFKFISIIIFSFGIITLPFFFFKINIQLTKNLKILILLTLVYLFICLSPITHADSLAYHLNSAVHLLNYGTFFKEIVPIESQTSGAGEILIALGLSTGAEHFATLVQISGVLSIISIFFNIDKKFIGQQNYYLLLSVLTAPVFLFFISSPKPQILAITNVLWVFSIIFLFFKKLDKNRLIFFYIFICLLLTINFLTKFSFIVSSLFLFIYATYYLLMRRFYIQVYAISASILFIFIFPLFLFKYNYFNINLLNFFQGPIAINIFGYDNVINSIRGPITFPSWLLFPPNNIANFSTIIGPVFLTFLLINFKNSNKNILFFFFVSIYFLIVVFFGQASTRFIFDSFLVLQFLLIFCRFYSKRIFEYFKIYLIIQTAIIIIISIYFIFRLFPGSLNSNYYNKVMSKNADGYNLVMWANKFLRKDDKIISTHRSISLFDVESIEYWTLDLIDFNDPRSSIYINVIKSKKINRILFYNNNQNRNIFRKCLGKLIINQDNIGRAVGRNPLTEGDYYGASIYELRYDLMPNCIIKR